MLFCPFYIEAQDNQSVKEKNRISRWIDSGKRFFKKREKKDEIHINLHELTLEENIKIPVPASSAVNNLKTALSQEVRRLSRIKHAQLSTPRKGEVIKVVIPMDQLFQPNDTLLWDRAELILRPFVKYVENPSRTCRSRMVTRAWRSVGLHSSLWYGKLKSYNAEYIGCQ